MSNNSFEENFDYGSFFPLLLFIVGLYSIYLLILNKFSQAFFTMMISLIIYIANNIIINVTGFSTVFNEYLEDMGSFTAFGITTIVFGLMFYKNEKYILFVVFFYAICLLLGLARNWISKLKYSLGWPIILNGVFFPLLYYLYIFYLQGPGYSIFIFYYIIIGILSISRFNFLGYSEDNSEYINIQETNIFGQKGKLLKFKGEKNFSNDDDKNEEEKSIIDINKKGDIKNEQVNSKNINSLATQIISKKEEGNGENNIKK